MQGIANGSPVFQFHKGTIKPFTSNLNGITNPGFNSIKVRLNLASTLSNRQQFFKFQFHKGTIKPRTTTNIKGSNTVFQFHKGTIKPGLTGGVTGLLSGFQFHKGTIKPSAPLPVNWRLFGFNSIKVRLNHKNKGAVMLLFFGFNSIKVRLNHILPVWYDIANPFQFHKGTIKPMQGKAKEPPFFSVSIP